MIKMPAKTLGAMKTPSSRACKWVHSWCISNIPLCTMIKWLRLVGKQCKWNPRSPWKTAHQELRNEPPHDIAVPLLQNPFLASLWIGSGLSSNVDSMRVEKKRNASRFSNTMQCVHGWMRRKKGLKYRVGTLISSLIDQQGLGTWWRNMVLQNWLG